MNDARMGLVGPEATVIDDLVSRAKTGDVDAFDRLVGMVGDRCFAIAVRILRDHHAAEDVVQASLIRAWRDLGSLRDASRFEAWLHRIVVNACYRETRRRRWISNVETLAPAGVVSGDDGPLSDRDELERGLRRLSPEHRAVLVMHYYLDLGVEDIAERAGIPVGTAKSRLHYGIAALRAALEAEARPATSPQEGIA